MIKHPVALSALACDVHIDNFYVLANDDKAVNVWNLEILFIYKMKVIFNECRSAVPLNRVGR